MIKTGIYTIDGLINKKKTDFFGKTKNVSISLYNELRDSNLPNKESLQDFVFQSAKLNRFYKVTYKNRFDELDKLINEVISEHYKNSVGEIKIHDAAVSDGRTSVEWYDALENQSNQFCLTASDLCSELKLLKKKRIQLVFDTDDILLQVVVPPFVLVETKSEQRFYLINKALAYYYFKKFKNISKKANHLKRFNKSVLTQIHPTCLSYMKSKRNFKYVYHNLFDPFLEKYDVIRVMNVLQQAYFSDHENFQILKNIFNSLNKNGLLITGSNDVTKSPINASIFIRKDNGFSLKKIINDGSRIHDLIEKFEKRVS